MKWDEAKLSEVIDKLNEVDQILFDLRKEKLKELRNTATDKWEIQGGIEKLELCCRMNNNLLMGVSRIQKHWNGK